MSFCYGVHRYSRSILATVFVLQWLTIMYLCMYVSDQRSIHLQIREIETREKLEASAKIANWIGATVDDKASVDISQVNSLKSYLSKELNLDTTDSASCGLEVPSAERLVCDEKYLGSYTKSYIYNGSWVLDFGSCSQDKRRNPKWGNLLTVIIVPEEDLDSESFKGKFGVRAYMGVKIVVGLKPGLHVEVPSEMLNFVSLVFLKAENENSPFRALLNHVTTPFVLYGRSLESLSDWSLFERSLRLLQSKRVAIVAGSTRDAIGHWRTPCHQAELINYSLRLRPGYSASSCDCMVCTLLGHGTPFMTSMDTLRNIPLVNDQNDDVTILNWMLDVHTAGFKTLLCPDVMYSVTGSWGGDEHIVLYREDWKRLATYQKVQGMVTEQGLVHEATFSCSEVGLSCKPEPLQDERKLLPWCCVKSYAHILQVLENISDELGIHFELQSGSLLGAIKIGHFLPWDIDGDLFMPTEKFEFFKSGGKADKMLREKGIQPSGFAQDKYGAIGVGFLLLTYGGIEVELVGRHSRDMSFSMQPQLTRPTRIRVSGVWTHAITNPGQYARSRYGPGYLSHAQSWRHEGMKSSFSKYRGSGGWKLCEDPRFHGCLEKYPTDGNIMFHQDYFKEWDEIPLEP